LPPLLPIKLLQIDLGAIETAIEQEVIDEAAAETMESRPCLFLAPFYQAKRAITQYIRRSNKHSRRDDAQYFGTTAILYTNPTSSCNTAHALIVPPHLSIQHGHF
jgi:hypothetical protein